MAKDTALVQRFEIRKARNGENFASLILNLGAKGDFSTLQAKIWQFDRFIQQKGRPLPDKGKLIEAKYRADEYRGAPQWIIEDYRVLEGDEHAKAIEGFVPPRRIDESFYQGRLEALMAEADEARVSARVMREIFAREGFREAFCHAPASISHHQNYPGGLLEHTINVTSLALALAGAYAPGDDGGLNFNGKELPVDRTLLIAAGLLHDIGKMDTYRLAPLSEATDANNFQGHLPISYSIVRDAAAPLRSDPPYEGAGDEIDKLLNCVLSHHGTLEFGSPVTPACVEAFLLAQADMTDARLASIATEGFELLRQNRGARWLRHFHFPGGMFVGDWPRPEEGSGGGE